MAVEEQTQYDDLSALWIGFTTREGQRLTIPNRLVTKLGFWLSKTGSPPGNITFAIRKVSNNDVILTKVVMAADGLTTSPVYYETEFDSPATINEEVRIFCEYTSGNAENAVNVHRKDADVKADELRTYYYSAAWSEWEPQDGAYRYTYTEPPSPAAGGGPASLVAAGII